MDEKTRRLTDAYNGVVAQNKSLQGELRLANKIVEIMAKYWLIEYPTYQDMKNIVEEYKSEALQELEAENDNISNDR